MSAMPSKLMWWYVVSDALSNPLKLKMVFFCCCCWPDVGVVMVAMTMMASMMGRVG